MKLKEYIISLQKMAKENPETMEYEVVSSRDDEGNAFVPIFYSPSIMVFDDGEYENTENAIVICVN